MSTQDVTDDEAAYQLGGKVLEMAERLAHAEKFAEGATATWSFQLDGDTFDVRMTRRPR